MSDKEQSDDRPPRLRMGEAYMMCHDCGARLYSFDGNDDKSTGCPYNASNNLKRIDCQPPGE